MATVNFRVDDMIKMQAYQVLQGQGITPTELFTNVLKYIMQTGKIPVKSAILSEDDAQLLAIAQQRSQEKHKFREISLDDL